MTCHYYFHVFFWVWLCLIDDALDFEYELRNRFDLFAKLRDIAKSQRKKVPSLDWKFSKFPSGLGTSVTRCNKRNNRLLKSQ